MYYVRQTFPLQRGGLGSRLRVLYTISLCYFMYPLHKILKNSFVISTGSGTSAVVSCGHTSFNGVWLCSCTSSLPCLIFGPALICSLCSPVSAALCVAQLFLCFLFSSLFVGSLQEYNGFISMTLQLRFENTMVYCMLISLNTEVVHIMYFIDFMKWYRQICG